MVRQEGGRFQTDLETTIATGVNLDWTLWWVTVKYPGQLYEFFDEPGPIPRQSSILPKKGPADSLRHFGDNLG